jgi:malonyl-CoA decarboxylase
MVSLARQRSAAASASRSWVERLWSSIAERGQSYAKEQGKPLSTLEQAKLLSEALLSERGEASGAAVARELHAQLRALGSDERVAFYRFLAEGFVPDPIRLRAAATAYIEDPTAERAALLAEAADPARQELLRRMNMSPGGTAALVAMRKELLARLRAEPSLKPLDADLRHLFSSWFNRGFLELRRIDWQTPAAVLEKLIAYEAVHEIQGWDDLRRRLAPDRRCFGFFHPALPGEPLIFVEVALVEGLAAEVQSLLARDGDEQAAQARAATADTAIFYSISNCQDGLRGVSFGNLLIKQVVEELKTELPHLTRFSTLSPIPGLRRWLEKGSISESEAEAATLVREDESAVLLRAMDVPSGTTHAATALLEILKTPSWHEDSAKAAAVRGPLLRLCAVYLTHSSGGKGPSDPVARFHLGNGARLERINWLGNVAPRGIEESFGLMVNYLYDPETIEANHEAFARDGTVARSREVDALLARPARLKARPAPHVGA